MLSALHFYTIHTYTTHTMHTLKIKHKRIFLIVYNTNIIYEQCARSEVYLKSFENLTYHHIIQEIYKVLCFVVA